MGGGRTRRRGFVLPRWSVVGAALALVVPALAVGGSATATGGALPARSDLPPVAVAAAPAVTAAAARSVITDGQLPTRPYTQCANTDGKPYATGLPPLPCVLFPGQPTNGSLPSQLTDNGAFFDPINQDVRRAKIELGLGPSVGRVFSVLCNATSRPCPPAFGFDPPKTAPYDGAFLGVAAYVFQQSPIPTQPQFGVVARTQSDVLAFGSIPGRATVTVSQQPRGDVVEPLILAWSSFTTQFRKGTVVPGYEKFGPSPGNSILVGDLSISGPVDITVSDLTIDSVPLDVGSNCRTSTQLDLFAKGGWISPSRKPVPNQPGEYQPFNPPSYAHGLVDVPAFSGCVTPTGEDVSPLVTGLVAGPDNPLDLTQRTIFSAFGCLAGQTPNCFNAHPATVPPEDVLCPTRNGGTEKCIKQN